MGDGPRGIEVFEDHFQASTSGEDSMQSPALSKYIGSNDSLRSISRSWTRRKLKGAASMLNMFSLNKLPWMSGTDGQEKVVLTAAEVESLRSELGALEEREAHCKAQLEHIDEVVRAARLSGYLDMRMRWATLPGEPLPVDDTDVDDWLPRFFVLQGSCIFWYSSCTDLSPQDSTLLSDVVEVGTLPCLIRDNEDKRYCFYISTRYGLKYECSSISKIKVMVFFFWILYCNVQITILISVLNLFGLMSMFKFPNWSSLEVEDF
ncbi:hypothetical protein H5410_062856 [Solanum commersonii]|uniref:Uncharacterized protein n=1 Tax=Solanum commersonii TaxID=4109 RepID=A0A9J5WBX9_SOLCO|nr:hypothetical protein H5410_062856 [Solanum commersonii]